MVVYYYTTPGKVRRYLGISPDFTSSTTPSLAEVENLIARAEEELETRTNRAFRKMLVENEYPKQMFREDDGTFTIFLLKCDIISITSLQYFDGSNWIEWIGTKTEARGNDYYVDYAKGRITLRGVTDGRDKVKVSYYHGLNETTINMLAGVTATDTTLTVVSTSGFPNRGFIRIDTEEIQYTGKGATTLTGCVRGVNGTNPTTHSNAATIIQLNLLAEELATKMVAYELIMADDRNMTFPEGGDRLSPVEKAERIRYWIDDKIQFLSKPSIS